MNWQGVTGEVNVVLFLPVASRKLVLHSNK